MIGRLLEVCDTTTNAAERAQKACPALAQGLEQQTVVAISVILCAESLRASADPSADAPRKDSRKIDRQLETYDTSTKMVLSRACLALAQGLEPESVVLVILCAESLEATAGSSAGAARNNSRKSDHRSETYSAAAWSMQGRACLAFAQGLVRESEFISIEDALVPITTAFADGVLEGFYIDYCAVVARDESVVSVPRCTPPALAHNPGLTLVITADIAMMVTVFGYPTVTNGCVWGIPITGSSVVKMFEINAPFSLSGGL